MDLQFILNLILGLIGLTLAAIVIPTNKLKWTFLFGYSCLVFYRLYDPSDGGVGTDWFRHLVVLVGELSFFVFISTFSKKYIEIEDEDNGTSARLAATPNLISTATENVASTSGQTEVAGSSLSSSTIPEATILKNVGTPQNKWLSGFFLPVATIGGVNSLYSYGSDQGVTHIFLAPIFLIIIAVVLTRTSAYSSPFKIVAKLFLLSYALGIMLHVGEFFLESHPVIALSRDTQHYVELFWYSLSSLSFFYTLLTFRKLLRKTNANQKTI